MNANPPLRSLLLSLRPARYLLTCLTLLIALIAGSQRAAAVGWASENQIAAITNFFDLGNDAFEVDAYPGIAAQGGWNTSWTLGFTAPQVIAAAVTADSPLNASNNYLAVTISNTTSSVAVRRQFTSYFNTGVGNVGLNSSTNLNTMDTVYIPMRIRFDIRVDSFTNIVSGTNNWSSRNDNVFISSQSSARTSPNTDAGFVIFVQGDTSRVQDPAGPANRWLYYDGNNIRTDQGTGSYVDSGMPFTFGTIYHFEVIQDPRDKTYTVQVDNGSVTNKSGPLRWRAHGDVTQLAARSFVTFGGNCNDTNSVIKFSVDSISVEHLPPSVFPPFISALKPFYRAPFLQKVSTFDAGGAAGVPPLNFLPDYDTPEFWPAGRGISFIAQTAGGGSNDYSSGTYNLPGGLMAAARTTIPTSGIGLVLNGVDVSGGLSITSPFNTANFRKVAYNSLQPNTFYDAVISITNNLGAYKQTRVSFNTLDEDFVKVIEAEDYNYGDGTISRAGGGSASTVGGLFQASPTPSDFTNNVYLNQSVGYVDRVALTNVDVSDTTFTNANVANNMYRFGDPVGTTLALDYRRSKYNNSGAREYQISLMQPNEWLNYTRTYAAGTYSFYLRGSSTITANGGLGLVSLDYVDSDPTLPGQTTTNIGTFRIPYTGNAQVFTNTPCVDTNTSAIITITLPAGNHTLRLTAINANNNLQLNYMIAAPLAASAPTVAITSPANGATFAAGSTIGLTAIAGGGTISQVQYFNGTTSIGTSSSGPTFPVSWPSVPTGRYTITAKATTAGGLVSKSAPITIKVGNAPKKVLFVRGGVAGSPGAVDAGNLGGGDAFKQSMFTSLGWTYTDLYATNLNFIGGMAAAADFDMIAVSVSVQASDINFNFRDTPVPLWNEEPSNMNGYSVSKDNPSSFVYGASGARGIYILRPDATSDPAAAGYPAGTYLLSPALNVGNRTTTINENAVVLLWSTNTTSSDSQSAFVWYYPAGAELFNGVIAPAVRYGWCNAANETQITNPMNQIGTNFMLAGLNLTMSNPVFTGVKKYIFPWQVTLTPSTITLPFRAASYDAASDLSVWSSVNVNGPYTNNGSAVITKPDPAWDLFEATAPRTSPQMYFRIRSN